MCLWRVYVCVCYIRMCCFLTCLRLPSLEDNSSTKMLIITVTYHLLTPEKAHTDTHTHADLHFKLYTHRRLCAICDSTLSNERHTSDACAHKHKGLLISIFWHTHTRTYSDVWLWTPWHLMIRIMLTYTHTHALKNMSVGNIYSLQLFQVMLFYQCS